MTANGCYKKLTAHDVQLILSGLNTSRSLERNESDEEDGEAKGLSTSEIQDLAADLKALKNTEGVAEMRKIVPRLMALEHSDNESDAEEAEEFKKTAETSITKPDFLTPTAVEDVFSGLSTLGRDVHVQKDTACEESVFKIGGVPITMQEPFVSRLAELINTQKHESSETLMQIEEELSYEQWAAERHTRFAVLNPNKSFSDSDILSYPKMRGADGNAALPWAEPSKRMSLADNSPDFIEARFTQAPNEPTEDFTSDMELIYELQHLTARIYENAADRSIDVQRRLRQCAHVFTDGRPLPSVATTGPFVSSRVH